MRRVIMEPPPAPAPLASLTLAGIVADDRDFLVLLRGPNLEESALFANDPSGYDAWDAWLADLGVQQVQACMVDGDDLADELALYLVETGHEIRVLPQAGAVAREIALDPLVLLDYAARGAGTPFVSPTRFGAERERVYARVS